MPKPCQPSFSGFVYQCNLLSLLLSGNLVSYPVSSGVSPWLLLFILFIYLIELYIAPLQGSLLRGALCAGLYDVKCCYERIFSVSAKIKHSKLKESPRLPAANKTPLKREKSLANSAKTPGTLTQFQRTPKLW